MKKHLINHHLHSTGSDGKSTPEKIVKTAIKKGINFICFTDHNPRPYMSPYCVNGFSKEYIEEVIRLRKQFKDKIEISFGIEVDWSNEHRKIFKKQIKELDAICHFDYILGSVHLVNLKGKDYLGINFDRPRILKEIKELGGNKLIEEYFKQIKLLAKSKISDCIAHFDVIKTMNKNNCLFDATSAFYKSQALSALREIKKNKGVIEINSSGQSYDCGEIYPSPWILKEAKKLRIPITIGTDAHQAKHLDRNLKRAYSLAKKVGYKYILKFKNRKPIKVKI